MDSIETFVPVVDYPRPDDEHANLITHALGFCLSLQGGIELMRQVVGSQSEPVIAACGVYVASLVGLYAASTLSHLFHDPVRRRFYRTLDQACIYFLIAGSCTPFGVVYGQQGWWQTLLPTMWVLAVLGEVFVFRTRNLPAVGKVALYMPFGWLPALGLLAVINVAPQDVVNWALAGGIFYTVGTLFLLLDHRVRYFHAVWHTLVIAGSTCHFLSILLLVLET